MKLTFGNHGGETKFRNVLYDYLTIMIAYKKN